MPKPLACVCHCVVLLAACRLTYSLSGFLITGGGLMLLLDRYALHVVRWPATAWRWELLLRASWWLAGAAGFYVMRPGLVTVAEAGNRGMMVCLGTALLGQAIRAGSGRWRPLWVRASVLGFLIALIPIVGGLHPLHTVPKRTPASWGFAFNDIRLRTADGVQVAAWVVPHSQPRGNVIFCHGHGRNCGHVAGHLQTFHDMGLNVLAFDFRGHGDSEGHTSTFGVRETEDLCAAVAYMTHRFPNQPLVIVGISLGAAVTLQSLPHLPNVCGVWSEAAFARLTSAMNHGLSPVPEPLRGPLIECACVLGWLDTGVWAPSVNPIDSIENITVPIFFCHGTGDELVPVSDGQALYAAYAGPKDHWWVQGASHYYVRQRNREEYLGRLRAFLEDCLSRTAHDAQDGPQSLISSSAGQRRTRNGLGCP